MQPTSEVGAMEDVRKVESLNPMDDGFLRNPYPTYRWLRENDPVHWSDVAKRWYLTRHEDCTLVLRHDDIFHKQTAEERGRGPAMSMLGADPPDHTRLRSLVNRAFTARRVEDLRPQIASLVDGLLDRIEHKGEADFIDAFAYPLPITVIAELIGVPTSDQDKFRQWSAGVALSLGAMVTDDDPQLPRQARRTAAPDGSGGGLIGYMNDMCMKRRAEPRDDLISALIAAEDEGDQLNHGEVLSMLILLLIAGHETTVNLLGNGLHALLRHPDQLERFRGDPSLAKTAVEEFLRYDSPVQRTGRVTGQDVEIGGQQIPKGQWVSTLVGGANRDPAVFAGPEGLDVSRDPNPQLSFSAGIHYCLGAQLARVEAQVAFPKVLERLSGVELAVDEPVYKPAPVLRGLEALPIRF